FTSKAFPGVKCCKSIVQHMLGTIDEACKIDHCADARVSSKYPNEYYGESTCRIMPLEQSRTPGGGIVTGRNHRLAAPERCDQICIALHSIACLSSRIVLPFANRHYPSIKVNDEDAPSLVLKRAQYRVCDATLAGARTPSQGHNLWSVISAAKPYHTV